MSILSKESIKKMILPHLSVSKNGKQLSENKLVRIVQIILFRLKTGCQWRELPMGEYFNEPYTHKSVFHHFNKWSKEGCVATYGFRTQGVAGLVQRTAGRHAYTCQGRWRDGSLPRQEVC
ncbi:MAG: transposase, partial [Bacteroidia bacterium]